MFAQIEKIVSGLQRERTVNDLANLSLKFRYEDLVSATGGFNPQHRIGAGSSGEVFRGCIHGGVEVAVKVLKDVDGVNSFQDEIMVLSRFRHPNLVTLMGWGEHEERGTKILVYELLPGGSIGRRLYRSKRRHEQFPWHHRLRVAYNAACGLSYMVYSDPKAFHRDISAGNILLDASGIAKMADFGLSCTIKDALQSHLHFENISGTPGYLCPEYERTGVVTERSEVYSFGVVLLELLLNELPAKMDETSAIVYPIMDVVQPQLRGAAQRLAERLDPTAEWPPLIASELARLALTCTHQEPKERASFADLVSRLRVLCDCASNNPKDIAAALSARLAAASLAELPREGLLGDGPKLPMSAALIQPACEELDIPPTQHAEDHGPETGGNAAIEKKSKNNFGSVFEQSSLQSTQRRANAAAMQFRSSQMYIPLTARQGLRMDGPKFPHDSKNYALPRGDHPPDDPEPRHTALYAYAHQGSWTKLRL